MMKRTQNAILALAIAGLFFIPGCKKATQDNTPNEAPAPAIQQLAVTAADWNKADVNGLLTYIPEDTAFILASTREFDLNSPGVKKLLTKGAESLDQSIAPLQAKSDAITAPDRAQEAAQIKAALDSFKAYRDLLKDFENVAPTWGLDALGHFDLATYMRDENFVAQMSLIDGNKLSEKATPTIDSYIAQMDGVITHEEIKSGDSTWHVYSAKKILDEMEIKDQNAAAAMPSKIAINYGAQLLTVVILSDKFDTNTLDKFLKPADKPLTKEALGKIDSTTVQTGFLDVTKLVKNLTSPTGLAVLRELELAEGEATEECINEYNSLATITPRLNFVTNFVNDEVVGKLTAVLSDKEDLKKLSALRTKSISVASDKSLIGLNLNLDVKGTLEYIKNLSAAIEAKNYKCSAVKNIPGAVKEVLTIASNPQIMFFIQGISGVNIAVDKLDLKAEPMAIEAVANLTGPSVGTTAPMLIGLASAESKEFAKLNLTKGQLAENIEFNIDDIKLKLNGLLTDTDLIYATPSYDVKALSESAKKDANFFDLMLDYSLISSIPSEYAQELESLKDYIITFSLGTDDEGITLITKSRYH